MKFLLRTPQAQAMLAALLGRYLAFALRTTRWTLDGQENFRPFGSGAPAVFAFWHEFLPLMPALVTASIPEVVRVRETIAPSGVIVNFARSLRLTYGASGMPADRSNCRLGEDAVQS